jgi:uncharacterized membrane protein
MPETSANNYRGTVLVLGAPIVVGLWFISSYAFTYFSTDPSRFGIFAPRQEWLIAHLIGGMAALLLGPLQLWLGLNRRMATVHRIAGVCYVSAVVLSATAACYLAFHTDFGWVFGVGLTTLAGVWLIATFLAIIAILRRQIEQHREWMVRSYVLTFGFVTFRTLHLVLDAMQIGTLVERMTVAAWLGWTIPLFITETVLQGRKIFASRVTAMPARGETAESAAPEPVAFDLHGSESSYLHRP